MSHRTYIAVVERAEYYEWLRDALESSADIARLDRSSLEDAISLVHMTGATLAFVEIGEGPGVSIIESLLAVKPGLTIIAVGPAGNEQHVLSAMRAGARDYISPNLRTSELVGMVRRLEERMSAMQAVEDADYDLLSVFSARADVDTSFIALHAALLIQKRNETTQTLLLDLGVCGGDTLSALGIEGRYTFADAVRNVRRLDENLIDSAFAKHSSGLAVLALPEDIQEIDEMSSAEVFLLLGTLQRYFDHIVVNLGGLAPSEFLHLLLGRSKQQILVVDQSVPVCQRNLRICAKLREARVLKEDAYLVIDRYQPKVPPNAADLAESFDLALGAALPDNAEQRLLAMNLGRSLLEFAPGSAFVKKLSALIDSIYTPQRQAGGWRTRFGSLFQRAQSQ